MKLSINHNLFYAMLIVLFLSCNQDPIFHAISQEVKPRDPRIPGIPTSMALFYRMYPAGTVNRIPVLYVASGRINWYAAPDDPGSFDTSWTAEKGEKWWNKDKGKTALPGGKIVGLAATNEYLYALYHKKILKRIKWDSAANEQWKEIPIDSGDVNTSGIISFDTIFSSNNRIFIGARTEQKKDAIPYSVLYVDEDANPANDTIKSIKSDTYLLEGVAYNGLNHFLCLSDKFGTGGSIFALDDDFFLTGDLLSNWTELKDSDESKTSKIQFKGIISMEDDASGVNHTILAMDRSGAIYTIDAAAKKFTASTVKKMGLFTGALALWRDPEDPGWELWDPADALTMPKPKLLLAGYQGSNTLTTSSYTNGYYELDLVWESGILDIDAADFHQPGKKGINDKTTVDNTERYLSTIGKYPVNNLYQTPRIIDKKMILFASTNNAGLWSYRERDNIFQWNAEE